MTVSASSSAAVAEALLDHDEEAVYRRRMEGGSDNLRERPKVIDLFCGAGGLTLGFSRFVGHRFDPVWANDDNRFAVETYNRNFGDHCLCGSIEAILSDKTVSIPKADVVIGGPPCQGFSLLNRNRRNDERKELWRPYMDVVQRSGASLFLMENVPQLLSSPEYDRIIEHAEAAGFRLASAVLVAADYGVPQTRKRAFILGCAFHDPADVFPPKRTHFDPAKPPASSDSSYVADSSPWRTVRDAVADLDPPTGTAVRDVDPPYDLHFGRNPTEKSKRRYRAIPEEGMNRFDLQRVAPELTPDCWIRKTSGGTDLFGRLWWDRPAFTIRTEFFKPEKGRSLHPEQHRPVTHREAARFQSFPDAFRFCGTKIEIARQIGNAVPPLLAARMADAVYSLWRAGRLADG